MRLYLDANAVLKRYVSEVGSDSIASVFQSADGGKVSLQYSLWTLGECLGVLDRLDRQGRLPRGGLERGRGLVLGETARLVRLGVLSITPLRARLIHRSWGLLLKHHLYQADAVHIATALASRSDVVLTSDAHVAQGAAAEGLRVLDPEVDGREIAKVLRS